MDEKKNEIHWRAKEYLYHKKSVDWYWYFAVVALSLIAFSLYINNLLFAFVVGIGAFTMLLFATKIPETIDYMATQREIIAGRIQYPYSSLSSFWISLPKKEGLEKILLIRSKKISVPLIVIPLEDANVNEIHDFLMGVLEEKKDSLPLGQFFMNLIGF